jgi:hypothetical protein
MDKYGMAKFCGDFQSNQDWVAAMSEAAMMMRARECSYGNSYDCCAKNYNAWANKPSASLRQWHSSSEADNMVFQF